MGRRAAEVVVEVFEPVVTFLGCCFCCRDQDQAESGKKLLQYVASLIILGAVV